MNIKSSKMEKINYFIFFSFLILATILICYISTVNKILLVSILIFLPFLFTLIVKKPSIILLFFLYLIVLDIIPKGSFFKIPIPGKGMEIFFIELFVVIIFIFGSLNYLLIRENKIINPRMNLYIIFYIILGVLAFFTGMSNGNDFYSIVLQARQFTWVLAFWVPIYYLRNEKQYNSIIWVIIAACIIAFIFIFYQYFFETNAIFGIKRDYLEGYSRLCFGAEGIQYLITGYLIASFLIEKGFKKKLFFILLLFFLTFVLFSLSRTTYLAVGSIVIFSIWLTKYYKMRISKKLKIILLSIFFLSLLIISFSVFNFNETIWGSRAESLLSFTVDKYILQKPSLYEYKNIQARIDMNTKSINVIAKNPIFGNGLGYWGGTVFKTDGTFKNQYTHNSFLVISETMGLPSLVLFLLIMIIYFKESIKMYKLFNEGKERTLFLSFLFANVGIIMTFFVDATIQAKHQTAIIFWFSIGMVFSLKKIKLKIKNN